MAKAYGKTASRLLKDLNISRKQIHVILSPKEQDFRDFNQIQDDYDDALNTYGETVARMGSAVALESLIYAISNRVQLPPTTWENMSEREQKNLAARIKELFSFEIIKGDVKPTSTLVPWLYAQLFVLGDPTCPARPAEINFPLQL
jgi:hypothetical protein